MDAPLSYSRLVALSEEEAAQILAREPREAARLAEAAARHGIADAQLVWAQMLMEGRGTPRDPEAGFRWFRVAAESERADALNLLARCHERGWGTPVDFAEAARLYRLAADKGHDWALFNLASFYLNGTGVERDERMALVLFVRAARTGLGKAMTMVGLAREQGWGGVPIKPGAAESWYRRGAARGDFRAHYYLAVRALRRDGIDAALEHLPQAVEGAFPDFCRELARDLKDHPDARVRALAARADARVREAETAVLPPLRERLRRRRRGPMRFLRLV